MSQKNNNKVQIHQGRFGLSVLNSMIGEYLEKENNPLAIKMGFYSRSNEIDLDSYLGAQIETSISNKVVIFIHGLSNLENVWDYPPDDGSTAAILSHYIDVCFDADIKVAEQNYGTKLNLDCNFTPLFLRYNTGLSLEKNAHHFSKILNKLFENYPITIDELVLVGYGMGGRLISHTQYVAQKSEAKWLSSLSRCIYLGNLNEGSLLTLVLRLGGMLVRQMPIFFSHSAANWLDQRSQHLQEQHNETTLKTNRHLSDSPSATFLENKRHLFIHSSLSTEGSDNLAGPTKLIPASAPAHSQNAYLENLSPLHLTHSDRVYTVISNWVMNNKPVNTYTPKKSISVKDTGFDGTASNDTGNDAGNHLIIAGTVGLVASAYDKTVEALETVHYSIAEEPFYALDKLPVVSQIAKPVEVAQREMLDNFYRNLRQQGKKIHKLAAEIA